MSVELKDRGSVAAVSLACKGKASKSSVTADCSVLSIRLMMPQA